MTDRESVLKMQDALTKEKEGILAAISHYEQTIAQHKLLLERTDGALTVVNKLLEPTVEDETVAPEPHKLNGKGKKGKALHA